MMANLLKQNLNIRPEMQPIKRYYEETGSLYLLEYCYTQFVHQFGAEKLKQLSSHPDILSINFPDDFLMRLKASINSSDRKKLLLDHLIQAANQGKEVGLLSLTQAINKKRFNAGTQCLIELGKNSVANNISATNSYLSEELQHNQIMTIMP